MHLLLKESIDRVLNLAINHMIEYIYNGKESNELLESFNQLSNYIDVNIIDDDNQIRFNRLKEIIFIVTGTNTYHQYDKKDPLYYEQSTLKEKIIVLENNFENISN